MLGIRLSAEAEARLARHARSLGRQKSAIARDWILERLERESVDAQVRRAAQILASHDRPGEEIDSDFDD
jgi:predicted DNA-binding protein